MEERDWTILVQLYEKRSITKAAQALFISQPALTARLHHIETRFGAQIVIRTKQGLHFTPQGLILLEYARDMLRRLHTVEGLLVSSTREVKGVLRIGASNFFTRHKLPELLRLFKKQYPDVDFEVLTNLSGKIVNVVYDRDVDVAFIRGEYMWPGQQDLLFTENMFVVAATPFELNDLPKMTQIDYISNKAVRDTIDDWWQANYATPPFVGMSVNSVDSCMEMVLKGLGYAFLPSGMLDHEGQLYKVLMLNREGKPLIRRTWMFYHEETLKIGLVKAFVDFVHNTDVYSL